jgi:proteasome accessory factor BC
MDTDHHTGRMLRMAKAERLVNLVALLLATRRPLTLDQVTELVPGYDTDGEALRRMFERDKDELRSLGVPIERGPVDPWGNEEGYFINPEVYAMPSLELAPDERAALALAAQVWAGTTTGQPTLAKLDLDPTGAAAPLQANLAAAGGQALTVLLDALEQRRRITFDYRPPGREAARRRLDPYALVHRRGTWYVSGHDPDRDALRSFRLSRITSEVRFARPASAAPEFDVPPRFDPTGLIPTAGERGDGPTARVRVSEAAARLIALSGAEIQDAQEGAATVRVPMRDPDVFLNWVLGNEGQVLEPPELRDRMAARLDALAARLAEPVPELPDIPPAGRRGEGGRATRNRPAAAGRVERLLALVPWVLAHPEASVTQVCARFGIDRATLLADLDLLFVSGLPPYGPGDLIEAWVEGDRIHIGLADYFSKTPRLTWREAVGLYLAARALRQMSGMGEHDALERACKRLEASLPASQLAKLLDVAGRVAVDLEGGPLEVRHLATLRAAAEAREQVDLEYYTTDRDAVTRRTVDPWVLFQHAGRWYLSGHCHRVGGPRLFRLDRILSARRTGTPFQLPEDFDPAAHSNLPAHLGAAGLDCMVALDRHTEWFATSLPVRGTVRLPDGRLAARLSVQGEAWILHMILRYAPGMTPLHPPALREAVAAAVQRLR